MKLITFLISFLAVYTAEKTDDDPTLEGLVSQTENMAFKPPKKSFIIENVTKKEYLLGGQERDFFNRRENMRRLALMNFFYIPYLEELLSEKVEKINFIEFFVPFILFVSMIPLLKISGDVYACYKGGCIKREALARNCPVREVSDGVLFRFGCCKFLLSLEALEQGVREEQLRTVLFYCTSLCSKTLLCTEKREGQTFIKGHLVPLVLLKGLGYKKGDESLPTLLHYIKMRRFLYLKAPDEKAGLLNHYAFQSERLKFFEYKGSCWKLAYKDRQDAKRRVPQEENVEEIKKKRPTLCCGLVYRHTMEAYEDFMNS